jgi:hypothetical protein
MNLNKNTSFPLLCFLLFIVLLCTCATDKSSLNRTNLAIEKQKGAHVFRFRDSLKADYYHQMNIEWITMVAWGFQHDYQSDFVRHYRGDSTEIIERNLRWVNKINKIKEKGFKVFVKPHVWLDTTPEDTWRSDIYPVTKEGMIKWQNDYKEFILRYARIAEEADADMFCVGAELTRLSLEQPEYWENLIDEIKSVYSGELTYAANWYEEYENIRFWDKLDYIGVQAYFPLSDKVYPSYEELEIGWERHLSSLKGVSKQYERPIIFTEIGYKSHSEAGMKPWEWTNYSNPDTTKYSEETQYNCYKAFYNKVWNEKWFYGAHLWQFRENYRKNEYDMDFSPQEKLAEKVIQEGFQK